MSSFNIASAQNRICSLRFLRFLLFVLIWFSLERLFAAPRPNIVVIMSDDMGFSDLGCYGGEIQTPTLDRLAYSGARLTQFYNTARCCPTRAALLTGLYPHQASIGHMMEDKGLEGYRGDLNRRCVTIAEVLRPAGYGTYAVGKPQHYYYTDAISDHAVRFIGDHHQASADKPFFLYVAFTAAHWPMQAL